jgi:hypothetical protein
MGDRNERAERAVRRALLAAHGDDAQAEEILRAACARDPQLQRAFAEIGVELLSRKGTAGRMKTLARLAIVAREGEPGADAARIDALGDDPGAREALFFEVLALGMEVSAKRTVGEAFSTQEIVELRELLALAGWAEADGEDERDPRLN